MDKRRIFLLAILLFLGVVGGWRLWPCSFEEVLGVDPQEVERLAASVTGRGRNFPPIPQPSESVPADGGFPPAAGPIAQFPVPAGSAQSAALAGDPGGRGPRAGKTVGSDLSRLGPGGGANRLSLPGRQADDPCLGRGGRPSGVPPHRSPVDRLAGGVSGGPWNGAKRDDRRIRRSGG